MFQFSLRELLAQASADEVRTVFDEFLRQQARVMLAEAMMEEVTAFCGTSYHPKEDASHRRAGSAPGLVVLGGVMEPITRPRVRTVAGKSDEKEVVLETYSAAQDPKAIHDAILRALAAGVSSRNVASIFPGAPAASSSAVSQRWITAGRMYISTFRERNFADSSFFGWFGMMLDGIVLADGITAIVALGLTVDGRKVVLDFEIGSTENFETCRNLLARLKTRGLTFEGRPLFVLDGSAALAKAVLYHYKDAHIQRCLVHKERNIRGCLSKRYHGELARLFNLLRDAEGEDAGREKVADLRRFLALHSYKAVESLEEAGDDLITLHRLNAPSTLNVSLLSTNHIENLFTSSRLKLNRVTRWRAETDQAERWLAYVLGDAEKGFHRIKGYRDIPVLLAGMGWPAEAIARIEKLLAPTVASKEEPECKTKKPEPGTTPKILPTDET